MDRESDFDGWADLGALRQAEDEMLIQRYASGEGRGLDMRPVRGFVNHVRIDLGPAAIICDVKMTVDRSGHNVIAWYYFPDGEATAARAEAVTSAVTRANEPAAGLRAPSGGLAALAHSTAPPPAFPTRPPPSRHGTGDSGRADIAERAEELLDGFRPAAGRAGPSSAPRSGASWS